MEGLNEIIVNKLINNNQTISFMESCTGGFLANQITNVSRASNVLKASLVTYSNEFKIKFGVSKDTIDKYTVYSLETAKEMAKKVSEFTNSSFGIGITGEFANKQRKDNKVYYAIYCSSTNNYINDVIFVEQDDREKMKLYVSNIIMENILKIL